MAEATKQRQRRAVALAKSLLESPPASYSVFLVKDPVFDVVAIGQGEVLALRVVVDEISSDDIRLVKEQNLPNGAVKKILKRDRSERGFEEMVLN